MSQLINSNEYVLIAPSEDDTDCEEFQLENDGSLLLSTLRVQYVNASGLKYRNPDTGSWRTLKIVEDRIFPPTDAEGWRNRKFIVAVPRDDSRKREAVDSNNDANQPHKKNKKLVEVLDDDILTTPQIDLIVLGLSFDDTEDKIIDFFSKFGEIVSCQLKISKEGTSRGFAFLRFKDRQIQRNVLLGGPYTISNRSITVRRADIKTRDSDACRLYVTKINDSTTPELISEYFSKYGKITDVFIPRKNFRNFGFVTFEIADSVSEALEDFDSHILSDGSEVNISRATPRKNPIDGTKWPRIANMGFSQPARMRGYDMPPNTHFPSRPRHPNYLMGPRGPARHQMPPSTFHQPHFNEARSPHTGGSNNSSGLDAYSGLAYGSMAPINHYSQSQPFHHPHHPQQQQQLTNHSSAAQQSGVSSSQEQIIYQAVKMALAAQQQQQSAGDLHGSSNSPFAGAKSSMGVVVQNQPGSGFSSEYPN